MGGVGIEVIWKFVHNSTKNIGDWERKGMYNLVFGKGIALEMKKLVLGSHFLWWHLYVELDL